MLNVMDGCGVLSMELTVFMVPLLPSEKAATMVGDLTTC